MCHHRKTVTTVLLSALCVASLNGAMLTFRSNDETLSRFTFCIARIMEVTQAPGTMRLRACVARVLHGDAVASQATLDLQIPVGKTTAIPRVSVAKGDLALLVLNKTGGGVDVASGFVELMPCGVPLCRIEGENDGFVSTLEELFEISGITSAKSKVEMAIGLIESDNVTLATYAFNVLEGFGDTQEWRDIVRSALFRVRDATTAPLARRMKADFVLSRIRPRDYLWEAKRKEFLTAMRQREAASESIREEAASRLQIASQMEAAEVRRREHVRKEQK